MISKVTFRRKVRDVFRRGDSFSMRPLTVMVGDNGCGKSTLLHSILSAVNGAGIGATESPRLWISKQGPRLERFIFADFEKDNRRTRPDTDPLGVFSALTMSHGETMMDEFVHCFARMERTLVLLDEPDQCLSPRSAYREFGILRRMVEENGCQVVASCHSVPMMEEAGEVLSLEHRRWMPYQEFLRMERGPATLRWVDDDDRFRDPAVLVHFDDGSEKYVSTEPEGLFGPRFHGSASYARTFRDRESAQRRADALAGRSFKFTDGFRRVVARVERAEVVMLARTFE